MQAPIDTLYANPLATISKFAFDEDVVKVFPDMIQRSVPGYATIINMIGELAGRYAQTNSVCYDLGCSLGAATLAISQSLNVENCGLIAVDNSPAMIERCNELIKELKLSTRIDLHCVDLNEVVIERASIVVLNFTLQFIPLESREKLLRNIYQGLLPGGVLILSEKISFEDSAHQALMIELHHNFKRANGYSELEIAQKRTALENVLIPETIEAHRSRLKNAGFSSVDLWFQCFNFASMIAIK